MNKRLSKNILHQYMITHKIFGNYKYIGEGSNGFAYHINEVVIKITTDKKELETAQYFYENPHPNIVEYLHIDNIDNIGIIRMEHIIPLNYNDNKELVNMWNELINPNSIVIFPFRLEKHRMDIMDLMSTYNFDLKELNWRNCGFNIDNKIKFFDLRFK